MIILKDTKNYFFTFFYLLSEKCFEKKKKNKVQIDLPQVLFYG